MTQKDANLLWQDALSKELDKNGLAAFIGVLSDMRDAQLQTVERLDKMERREAERDIKMDEVFNAFPAKDAQAHRRYHEILIEQIEEKRKLRVAITEKTVSGLIWSIMVFVGICIWDYVSHKVGAK